MPGITSELKDKHPRNLGQNDSSHTSWCRIGYTDAGFWRVFVDHHIWVFWLLLSVRRWIRLFSNGRRLHRLRRRRRRHCFLPPNVQSVSTELEPVPDTGRSSGSETEKYIQTVAESTNCKRISSNSIFSFVFFWPIGISGILHYLIRGSPEFHLTDETTRRDVEYYGTLPFKVKTWLSAGRACRMYRVSS